MRVLAGAGRVANVNDAIVVIVSRHPVCRMGLAGFLTAELGEGAVREASSLDDLEMPAQFQLIIVDANSPSELAEVLSDPRLASVQRRILMAPERDFALARRAHAHGFSGLLPKTDDGPLMVAAIKLVLAGGEYFPCFEEIDASEGLHNAGPIDRLSKRQKEVLEEMRQGRTNKEIAKTLGISIATVKLHVQAVLSAAGARNRTEAVSRLAQDVSLGSEG